MKINDQAGEKIRRPHWVEGRYYQWFDGQLHNEDGDVITHTHIYEALATDYEVVEDKQDIEVGDVVKMRDRVGSLTVLSIDERGELKLTENRTYETHRSDPSITIIRKGPKVHVFEGARVLLKSKEKKPMRIELSDDILEAIKYIGTGKYKMTLEEMPDEE